MLRRIEKLLKENGAMTTGQLARLMDTDSSAMEGMLITLEQRGKIEKKDPATCGKQCSGCPKGSDKSSSSVVWEIRK